MSNNPRHIVQRYYVPPEPSVASGAWSIKEQQQAAYDGLWLPAGIIPSINYLAIGGGGSGGNATEGGTISQGGAGGAGGLIVGSFGPTYKQPGGFTGYTLTITVGAGGQPIPQSSGAAGNPGNNGENTTISGEFFNTLGTLIAYGGGTGGGGAQFSSQDAGNGGSGGGQGGYTGGNTATGGSATQPTSTYGGYGNAGGRSSGLGAAGGGGAGGAGSSTAGGAGLYVSVANGSTYAGIYGRGGGLVTDRFSLAGAAAGYGSGGNGGYAASSNISNLGGVGQNGVVIFWYNLSFQAPSVITGTYTYSVQNEYRIYVFNYPGGTITF